LLRPTLGEQIEIESVFEDESCLATVDPNQLSTAILNLAINARDAMPHGGKLILETRSAVLDENYATRTATFGRPLCPACRQRHWNRHPRCYPRQGVHPFFTSKEPGKGTGLA